MAWYKAGRVAVTSGSAVVTGTGTDFASNARVGDAWIGPNGALHEVINVASPTVLSISPVYGGATTSNAVYGIVPVQGYVKQLVDQAGQIITQWGSTLAGLGAVSTENVVPIAKGGTGATTAPLARSGLGLKTAATADILGTVSQAGGVPTGAIIERGSNANGGYVKYADGTMLAWVASSNSQSVATGTGVEITVPFPATFVGTVSITGNAGLSTSGTTGLAARIAVGFPFTVAGTSSARVHIFNTTGITIGGFSYFLQINGWWF